VSWPDVLTNQRLSRSIDARRRSEVVLAYQRQSGNKYVQRLMSAAAPVQEAGGVAEPAAGEFAAAPLSPIGAALAAPPAGNAGGDDSESGNGLVQRQPEAPPNNVAKLDELLDRFNTPEDEVISLLATMRPTEKQTVISGYRDKLARTLNFAEMKQAVVNLGTELPVSLDWLEKAALIPRSINYSEIQKLITDAPQPQRDMLKNERWKSFFMTICTNRTIITAVTDLKFDLPTQLTWIRGEASALFWLSFADLKPLLAPPAARADLDIVAGEAWRSFWVDVCNNKTMMELVDILFPDKLEKKLEWMEVEGTDWPDVKTKINDAKSQAERDALKTERWKQSFMSWCTNKTMIEAVQDLKFDLPTQLTWVRGEASTLFLNLNDLKPLLEKATPADLDIAGGDAFRPFWMEVCNPATIKELVDLLFPTNLARKLEWMLVKGELKLPDYQAKVTATTDAAQKLGVFANNYVKTTLAGMLAEPDFLGFMFDLGGDWDKWRDWALAKGTKYLELARAAIARSLIPAPVGLTFVNIVIEGSTSKLLAHLRGLSDADLATLKATQMATDLINEAYATDAAKLTAALNGESRTVTQNAPINETLQTGSTSSPFVPMPFSLNPNFTVTYRDKVNVSVGVNVTAAPKDKRAATLLPAAKTLWLSNILGAWNNKFKLQNSVRELPITFKVSLDAGPNPVLAHSYKWVWPNLNAGNWIVPDDRRPSQKAAVSTAPIHEFGHLIGNPDEYNLSAAHYVAVTGKVAATDPNGVPETDSAGNIRYTNSLSLMGSGSTVLATHFGQILNVVNANLLPDEPAFTVVPV